YMDFFYMIMQFFYALKFFIYTGVPFADMAVFVIIFIINRVQFSFFRFRVRFCYGVFSGFIRWIYFFDCLYSFFFRLIVPFICQMSEKMARVFYCIFAL